MRILDEKLIDALIYARADRDNESVTSIADKFGIERHGLAKNIKKNLIGRVEFQNNE